VESKGSEEGTGEGRIGIISRTEERVHKGKFTTS